MTLRPLINEDYDIVWKAIPGTSQEFAVDTRAHHTLYHGTRGPGKTITQLMRFRRRVGIGYCSYWRGIIFDREYKNFSDIIAQSKRFFNAFGDGAKFHESPSDLKWTWPTGEELLFRHVKKIGDYENFHGHEYPFIGWNELTKQPTGELYDKMMSTNRSSFDPVNDTPMIRTENGRPKIGGDGFPLYDTYDNKPLPNIPLEVFSATNPSGAGHNWVKRRFINPARNGEIVRTEIKVFSPKLQCETTVIKTQVAIFGSYKENIYLSDEYIAELDMLTANNPNLRAAWLEGDWDVTAGGALDDLWNKNIHVKPRFKVPAGWYLDRSFDWGSSHPFSVGWWAMSNGEAAVLPDGSIFCPVANSLVRIADWYGTTEIGTNKGLKLTAFEIAEGIKHREMELMGCEDEISTEKNAYKYKNLTGQPGTLRKAWISAQPAPGPADNQIANKGQADEDSIEQKMESLGVLWEKSNKSSGSRKNGLQLLREMLAAATDPESDQPGIYFMQNCEASIETLPCLPRDELDLDDVDSNSEDHVYDEVRYRVLKGSERAATSIEVSYPT